ncbi:MAG: TonB-dependent receptor plug domain-containing protein, partial [Gemmatimonadota bacterium]|nr:TonB-dependent receptor plug domain-containing protein [Gemmatimonadota bacterium]
MRWSHVRQVCSGTVALLAATVLASPVLRAQATTQAGITGRVVDAASQQPIAEVRVVLVGRSLVATTNTDGRYTLRGVPAGAAEVRVLRIGYSEQKKSVTVPAGATATLDFAMQPAAVQLNEVVTTAGGAQQRRLEVANDIGQIDAAKLTETSPIANMNDLLVARTPGVQVLPGNMTGTGARVRIRGVNSLSLSNDPIYVIDGVRMESSTGSSSIDIGGSFPSRVDDINPNDIESIEIVKGPSAATLYGTDAANGVIVITTKRGRSGSTRWTAFGEGGVVTDRNTYPTAYTRFGHLTSGAATTNCFNSRVSLGTCTPDSLKTFNLFDHSDLSPIGTGARKQAGLSVSGGTEAIRYFFSGSHENESGVLEMPSFERTRLMANGVGILDEWLHPNTLTRSNLRGNVNVQLSNNADVAVSTAYISSGQTLPQTDNNTTGILSNAY